MKFKTQSIEGVVLIVADVHQDERGGFHRSFCEEAFSKSAIEFKVKQGNISRNRRKHTLRGFHYQAFPTQEAKVLSCIEGAIYNVVLDLREDSSTRHKWEAVELDSGAGQSLHVPPGCANAFITLQPNTVVHYYMSEFFREETYRGIRFDDPYFKVVWPAKPAMISSRDASFPDFLPG